jgi:hypothetical protein
VITITASATMIATVASGRAKFPVGTKMRLAIEMIAMAGRV